MRALFRLAWSHILYRPTYALAPALGVALGIAAVLATSSVGSNVQANVQHALLAATGNAQLLVAPGAGGRTVFRAEDVFDAVQATAGVARVRAVLDYRAEPVLDLRLDRRPRGSALLPGAPVGFLLSGRTTEHAEDVPATVVQGVLPQAGSHGVALAAGFAHHHALRPGDSLSFATPFGVVSFGVTGLLDDALGLASTNGGRVAVAHLSDLQSALRLDGRVSFLEVVTRPGVAVTAVRERVGTKLGETYLVTAPAHSGDVTAGVVDTLEAGLRVLAVTLLVLGGFIVYNTVAASVVERRRAHALLRTICLTGRQIQALALLEALLVGLCGVALGLALGLCLSLGLTHLNATMLGFEVRTVVLAPGRVLAAALTGTAVCLAAAWLPARLASRTPPLGATRLQERPPLSAAVGWLLLTAGSALALAPWQGRWAVAASAAAMGLLFAGFALCAPALLAPTLALLRPLLQGLFGMPGRLGASFTLRHAARNGVAVSTVACGLALSLGVGAWIAGLNHSVGDWVDTTVVGDLFVTSPVGFPAGFEQEVRARLSGVEAVSGVSFKIVRFEPEDGEQGRSVTLVLVDPERFHPERGFGRFRFVAGQGESASAYEALKGGAVFASSTLLDRFGVARGARARLRTSEGFRDFPVAAVVVDFTAAGESFVASLAEIARFGGGQPDLFVMTVHEDQETAATRLAAAFPDLHLEVSSNRRYKERILALTRRSLLAANSLLLLAVLIAALGVASVLGMNLSQRRHEVAVLRSLGLCRSDVARMVMAEAVVLVMLGTVLGVAARLLLAHVLTAASNSLTGYRILPSYPWRLMLVAFIASPLLGAAVSLLPAWRTARLPPALALASED